MSFEMLVIGGELILACAAILYAMGRNSAVMKSEVQRVDGKIDGHVEDCERQAKEVDRRFDAVDSRLDRGSDIIGQNTIAVARLEGFLRAREEKKEG